MLGVGFDSRKDDSSIRLYAIGSYLSTSFFEKTSVNQRVIVVGMGAGYVDLPVEQSYGFGLKFPVWIRNHLNLPLPSCLPSIGRFHRILWVRGPLTARLLGLSPDTAIADAGYLIRHTGILSRSKSVKRRGLAFMPHITAASASPRLREICESVGIRYIDPHDDVSSVLEAISSCEVLLTEALHGAIVSDALRVPWIPLRSSDDVFEFKWLDFCASIQKDYRPQSLNLAWDRAFYNGRNPISLIKNVTTRGRSLISRLNIRPRDTALSLLRASAVKPMLSDDCFIHRVDSELPMLLDQFQQDARQGTLFATA
jgi:succinoglycan biosynthesis protein ExoV